MGNGLFNRAQSGISGIDKKGWIFLILSGLATGASWLCYYRAVQIGDVSKVVPIDKLSVIFTILLAAAFLGEKITVKNFFGMAFIACGTLLML